MFFFPSIEYSKTLWLIVLISNDSKWCRLSEQIHCSRNNQRNG